MPLKLKIFVLAVIVPASFMAFHNNHQSLSAQGPSIQGPSVGPLVRPGSFTGDLRQLPRIASPSRVQPPGRMMPPRQSLSAPITDPVRQASSATVRMPTTSANFDGLTMAFNGGSVLFPPDPNGDVNSNYYVQTAILGIGIFDKMTGTQLVTMTMASLWSTANTGTPCDADHVEDPVVVYDPIAKRWLVTDMAWADTYPVPASNFYQCVAVSKTDDPITGGWWFYPFFMDASKQLDYSRLAVWSDGYYGMRIK